MGNSSSKLLGTDSNLRASRTPGTLGRNDAADPDLQVCKMGDTPGPVGSGGDLAAQSSAKDRAPRRELKCLVYDLSVVASFLRSVALAKAQQYYTRVDWEEYDKSTVLNVIYALMPWKGKPGTAVVIQGESVQVYARADRDSDHLLEVFLAKCTQGPEAAQKFLRLQEDIRSHALSAVEEAFRDASKINQEVIEATAEGIKRLALIKCGSNLLMTGLSLGGGGLAVFGTNLGYTLLRDLASGKDADTVAVSVPTEVGKEIVGEVSKAGGQAAYDKMVPAAVQGMDRWSAEAAVMQKQELISKYQQELIGKGSSKQAQLLTRIRLRSAEAEALKKAASPARQAAGKSLAALGKSVKFLFAAKEAYDSVAELAKTWSEAEVERPLQP